MADESAVAHMSAMIAAQQNDGQNVETRSESVPLVVGRGCSYLMSINEVARDQHRNGLCAPLHGERVEGDAGDSRARSRGQAPHRGPEAKSNEVERARR